MGGQALKVLLREPCGVSTGAVAVSAGWAFFVPIRSPLSHPPTVPSTSPSNVTLQPNKLREVCDWQTFSSEFVKGSLIISVVWLV
jgi:hypothetical protein